MPLTIEEVKEHLCYHDKRNPFNYDDEDYEPHKKCFCDNCYHGKTPIAEQLLDIMEFLKVHSIEFKKEENKLG